MLRLQSYVLNRLLPSPATSPVSPLHRLLSAAAAAVSPSPRFAVEEYLVATCGLTRVQALKASAKLSHLKSPTNPDAVLAFLAGLGLSSADVAALVSKDPKFLCASVERTLEPNVVGLTDISLSRSEIARLASLAPDTFRRRSIVSTVPYFQSLFGSIENLAHILKQSSNLLGMSLEKVVKPNVAFLQECGLGACDIASLQWILTTKPEHLWAMAARAEAVGVPRGSWMFKQALRAVAFLSDEKIAVKVEYLKNMFSWSDPEVRIAVCKFPMLLKMSNEILQSKSEFLISEVGLEPAYIARRPAIVSYSLEGRLRPRYYVVKFLKENGLQDHDRDCYNMFAYSEKVFVEKCISPHKEAAPHLAEDYATACKGQVPTRFIFS